MCKDYILYKITWCKKVPGSVFRKPWFSHTFSVIWQNQNFRKCMEKLSFSKNWSRTSLHSRFRELFLWTRKLLFSKRKHQICEFGKNKQTLNSNTNLRISRHLTLITNDATMSVNSSFVLPRLISIVHFQWQPQVLKQLTETTDPFATKRLFKVLATPKLAELTQSK